MTRARTEEEFKVLVDAFQTDLLEYKEWHFEYEHPQFFVYYNDDAERVYFTPDWDGDGSVHIQIEGGRRWGRLVAIPYPEGLTPEQLFEIVKPYLDGYHSRKAWSPREGE